MKFRAEVNDSSGLSRPLRGGRGLKLWSVRLPLTLRSSPPTRGAWIEIIVNQHTPFVKRVAPYEGGVD